MKPNFALSLSFDGIRLLHRAAGGWHLVGDVSVSDPDLSGALAGLLAAGKAVKTRRLRSKLIIPDEQIKYLSIDTPGMDDAARRAAASAALDGATPYPVNALAFDISPDGDATHVAAVARETLAEAEAFATEHGFNPVSFVAAAAGTDFLGEPYFGQTGCAPSLMKDGASVEPDGVRVVIVDAPVDEPVVADAPTQPVEGFTPTPVADPRPEPSPKPTNPAPAAKTAQPETSPVAPKAAPDVAPKAAPDVAPKAAPDVAPPEQDAQSPEAPRPVFQRNSSEAASPSNDDPAAGSAPAAETGGGRAISQPFEPAPQDAPAAAKPVQEHAPPEQGDPEQTDMGAPEPTNGDTTTPPLLGFATRRRQNPGSTPSSARLGGVSRDLVEPRTTPPVAAPITEPPKDALALNLTTPPRSTTESLRPKAPSAENEGSVIAALAAPKGPGPRPLGGFLSRRKPSADAAALKPAARKSAAGKRPRGDTSETERMTVFGARDSQAVGGKPRFLGLILMAVLLVFLAGVAAWATVFLDDGLAKLFQGRERTLASTLPDDARDTLAQDVGATTDLEPDAEETADGVVVAALNDNLAGDVLSAEDAAVLDALRNPLPDPIAPEELDESALQARYAVTGIWPKAPVMDAPADLIALEDLYVTSIDPVSPALDAVAMPTAASLQTDSALAVVTSPVAAGTNFARGPDGRIIPTPQGALSPDGFTVFLGRPPAVPPATFVRLEVEPDVIAPDLSALAQVRPQPRPDNLIEQNERATLGGLSRNELAALRPRLRPKAPQDQAEEAPEADPAETETATATPEPPVSALAAATSLRPETRPRNFTRIVARATRSAPQPEAEPTRTASVAPRAVTPSIPSSASVTREATVRNAINLGRVNLIGVYGTPSNRRALVRLSNGRFQKVEVGDRFDGGRVSAIGDSELRYQKGNSNVVLKMPNG